MPIEKERRAIFIIRGFMAGASIIAAFSYLDSAYEATLAMIALFLALLFLHGNPNLIFEPVDVRNNSLAKAKSKFLIALAVALIGASIFVQSL